MVLYYGSPWKFFPYGFLLWSANGRHWKNAGVRLGSLFSWLSLCEILQCASLNSTLLFLIQLVILYRFPKSLYPCLFMPRCSRATTIASLNDQHSLLFFTIAFQTFPLVNSYESIWCAYYIIFLAGC